MSREALLGRPKSSTLARGDSPPSIEGRRLSPPKKALPFESRRRNKPFFSSLATYHSGGPCSHRGTGGKFLFRSNSDGSSNNDTIVNSDRPLLAEAVMRVYKSSRDSPPSASRAASSRLPLTPSEKEPEPPPALPDEDLDEAERPLPEKTKGRSLTRKAAAEEEAPSWMKESHAAGGSGLCLLRGEGDEGGVEFSSAATPCCENAALLPPSAGSGRGGPSVVGARGLAWIRRALRAAVKRRAFAASQSPARPESSSQEKKRERQSKAPSASEDAVCRPCPAQPLLAPSPSRALQDTTPPATAETESQSTLPCPSLLLSLSEATWPRQQEPAPAPRASALAGGEEQLRGTSVLSAVSLAKASSGGSLTPKDFLCRDARRCCPFCGEFSLSPQQPPSAERVKAFFRSRQWSAEDFETIRTVGECESQRPLLLRRPRLTSSDSPSPRRDGHSGKSLRREASL